ncbi:DNA-directed RNA polymerase I subunit RPA2 like protein [Argiope bruennichi]|uniref:DNA-directed RNA polymerase n=2 Tax=Argiope bruennichi TaxID=94029 RepID=A0A8T0FVX8_ARGBR|nr:DNA-directed RNA polymerase I subunit RPA2 like protein [Argiope bruennichi]
MDSDVEKPSYLKKASEFHIDSFNYVFNTGLKTALLDIDPVHTGTEFNVEISISEVKMQPIYYPMDTRTHKKVSYPSEIRERKATYNGELDIVLRFETDTKVEFFSRIFYIPIMVKSDFCLLKSLSKAQLIKHGEDLNDPGGYFIVDGSERIIRTFVMPRRNYPLALVNQKWKLIGNGYSQYAVFTSCNKENHTISDIYLHYVNSNKDTNHPSIEVRVFYRGKPYFIPLILLIKSLVDESDHSIIREIAKFSEDPTLKLFLKHLFRDLHNIKSTDSNNESIYSHNQAKNFIGKLFRPVFKGAPNASNSDVTDHFLKSSVFIHLDKNEEKFQLFCFCICKLFALARNQCISDDLDNPVFNEILSPGQIYLLAVKNGVNYFLNSVKNSLRKEIDGKFATTTKRITKKDFDSYLKGMAKLCTNRAVSLTPIVKSFIATGNLPGNHGLMSSTGYTVALGRYNVFETASQFNGIYKFSMSFYPQTMRKFYPESWGFLCPAHTPEGENNGLYNHFSLGCEIVSLNTAPLETKVLHKLGVLEFYDPCTYSCFKKNPVFVDGKILGWIKKKSIPSFITQLKFLRSKKNFIPNYTEIVPILESKHCSLFPGIFIFSTPCRLIRQVRNNLNMNYELIGAYEQLTVQVKSCGENDAEYSEINNYNFLGMAAALIPFGENNPAQRNIFTTCKSNQAVSFPFSNLKRRSDTKSVFLTYPQIPIVATSKYAEYNWDENPTGTNLSIAIISYSGYDIEDAIVLNKASVDRGLMSDIMYKTMTYDFKELAEDFKHKDVRLIFKRDPSQPHLSEYLDVHGIPHIGKRVEKDSPILSVFCEKTKQYVIKTYQNRSPAFIETVKLTGVSAAKVDKRLPTENQKIVITFYTKRIPVIGDKFFNRQSQKGICSAILPPEDLPFSADGFVPDILFNPHGIPSRMSIGMLLEILASLVGVQKNRRIFVEPFEFSEKESAAEYFGDILKKIGLNFYGTQKFYSGTSGEELEADIFCGFAYYFRLKHVVEEKYQVGSVAEDVDIRTMQPLNVNKAGAIKFGEMERDAILSHGAMNLTMDRLLLNSDSCKAFICEECQQVILPVTQPPNHELQVINLQMNTICRMCQKTSASGVRIPDNNKKKEFLSFLKWHAKL